MYCTDFQNYTVSIINFIIIQAWVYGCHSGFNFLIVYIECHDYATRLDISVLEEVKQSFSTQASTLVCPEFKVLGASILLKCGIVEPATNYADCLYQYFVLLQELNELFI